MTVRPFDEVFRDFVIPHVPASGVFHPEKKDIRDSLNAVIAGPFPDNRVIKLNNANEGTPNEIIVSAAVDIPAAAYQVLYILNVTQENTGPVTVSGAINRALVTNINQPVPAGYLTPGMALLCIDTGTELRLLSYGDAEAVQAAAEAAAERAEDAAAAAEAAAGGLLSNFASRADVQVATIPSLVAYVRTAGYSTAGDGGAALYRRVSSEPSHPGKVQSSDGAWWELAENRPSVKMFGAKGDGTTDDAAALGNAFSYCYSHLLAPELYIPAGYYKIAQALPDISKSITITGDGPRTSMLMLHGNNSTLNIRGASARATDVTFDNFSVNASNMTAGSLAVRLDFAQSTLFSDFMVYDPYNGIYIRQAGETTFRDSGVDGTIRGEFGIYAYGENVTRNGQNDQIDIIVFANAVLQANYQKGGAIPTAELVVLDGRIHTVQVNGLRLLNALRGLRTKNTPGLAKNLVPRFITGDALEVENTYAENILIEYGTDIWIDNVFAAGSFNADGINIKSTAGNVRFEKGSINSNKLHGLNNEGCSSLIMSNVDTFNNSLGTGNTKSGIYCAGSGHVRISGGFSGLNRSIPAYSEPQKYGIELDVSFNGIITVDGIDLRGNATGAFYDNNGSSTGSSVRACPGYNPKGSSLQTVGASPYAYTAGLTEEMINIYSGTGVTVTIDGTIVANQSPCSFALRPRKTATIAYATLPTMAVTKA